MRILIAEDDPTSRAILAAILRKNGYDVIETDDSVEALDMLQKPNAPRLAVLDWMMPKMDGVEVVRRLRAIQTDRPPYLIMLTTKNAKADVVAGLDAGADDYLAKPFDHGELRARIQVGRRLIEAQDALASKIAELEQALDQIKTLRGIIPICACCKKVRNDAGYWQQVEVYVRDHTEAQFSHGICPECAKTLYPGYSVNED